MENKKLKRRSIFAFYDKEGIVDKYVLYMLQQMKKVIDYQIFVVNGMLDKKIINDIKGCCDEIVIRENKGYDVSAYKQVYLDNYDKLSQYDEILFYNQTVFGPVFDVEPIFEKMSQSSSDFWGMLRHPGIKNEVPSWLDGWDHMPPHIQSWFILFRKNVFYRLKTFLKEMKEIDSYYQAISQFEIPLTEYLEKSGYKSDTFIDSEEYNKYGDYSLIENPIYSMEIFHCPFVKRRAFLTDSASVQTITRAYGKIDVLKYIQKNTNYDVNLIVENLTRTSTITEISIGFQPYEIYKKNDINTNTNKKILYVVVADKKKGLAYEIFLSYCKQLELKENVDYLLYSNDEVLFAEESRKEILSKIDSYEYCCYVNTNYPNILERFFPIEKFRSDMDILFDFDTCVSILEDMPFVGALSPALYDSCEFYMYSQNGNKSDFNDKTNFIHSIYDSDKYIDGFFNGNCFVCSELFKKYYLTNTIAGYNMGKPVKGIVEICFNSSKLPLLMVDNNLLFETYKYSKNILNKYKDLSIGDRVSRFDDSYDVIKHKVKWYNENNKYMILKQDYYSHLDFKSKLYVIYHLLFNKDEK